MVSLKQLQMFSQQRKKTTKADMTIAGLVWRVSATGQVSAAYRIQGRDKTKRVNAVFYSNMPLQPEIYKNVRKQAMAYMVKAANGEQIFDEPAAEPQKQSYTIGEYFAVFLVDRPLEQNQKSRLTLNAPNTVRRDKGSMNWLLNQQVGRTTLRDVDLNDPKIASYLDRIVRNMAENGGRGKGQFEKALPRLKTMFKIAVRNQEIGFDPLFDYVWSQPESKVAKAIPPDELGVIIAECRKFSAGVGRYKAKKWARLGILFEIKAIMGTRNKELNTLEKSQVCFNSNTFTLRSDQAKTRKEYRFAFTSEVARLLKSSPAWDEPNNKLVFGINSKPCDSFDKEWHFMLDGTSLFGDVEFLEKQKRRLLKRRRVNQLHPDELIIFKNLSQELSDLKTTRYRGHDTRHAFATDQMRSAVQAGMVMSERDQHEVLSQIGKGLQHSDTKTTAHYVRPDDEIKRKMVENRQAALQIALSSAK